MLGPKHPDTAISLFSLASLLREQGDYAGARPLLERVLSIDEARLGKDHPEVAFDLNHLARSCRTKGSTPECGRCWSGRW